jgi:hypothetical protein
MEGRTLVACCATAYVSNRIVRFPQVIQDRFGLSERVHSIDLVVVNLPYYYQAVFKEIGHVNLIKFYLEIQRIEREGDGK